MRSSLLVTILATVGFAAFAAPARAENPPSENEGTPQKSAPPTPSTDLPPAQSDSDVQPPVATPVIPPEGVIEQAGVGGPTGYGRAGVLELGGSAGLIMATDLRELNVSPSIGWFVADNLELSGILSVSHVGTNEDKSTLFSALIEPSYHLPFDRSKFGFFGLGIGGSYVSQLGGGFAMAPRLGANFMVGRSGILTPSLSWQYTTHDTMALNNDTTLLAVSSALRVNVGYTVMW